MIPASNGSLPLQESRRAALGGGMIPGMPVQPSLQAVKAQQLLENYVVKLAPATQYNAQMAGVRSQNASLIAQNQLMQQALGQQMAAMGAQPVVPTGQKGAGMNPINGAMVRKAGVV